MPTPLAGVYVIQSTRDPRQGYIGQSKDIGFRWTNELNQLRAGRHHNADLQAAYSAAPRSWVFHPLRLGLDDADERRAAEAEEIARARQRGKLLFNKLDFDDGRDWQPIETQNIGEVLHDADDRGRTMGTADDP